MIFIIWELGYGYILELEDTIHPTTYRKGRASVNILIFKTLEWKAHNRHIKRLSQKLLFHSYSEIGLGMLPIPPALKEGNEHCLGC